MYFRKDNFKFILKFITSFAGFIITNFSLIRINDFMNPFSIVVLLICIASFTWMMLIIFYKYEYYHGLATHLQQKNKHLFLICSYISKSRRRRNDNKVNNFTISEMDVIYDIDVPSTFNADKETYIDFTVTYRINAVNNGGTCSRIYHSSLSKDSREDIIAKYKIEREKWSDMKIDSYFKSDNNLQLWYGLKSGNPLAHREPFHYSIKIDYEKGYHLLNDNCFLIDPQNYGRMVRKINIIVQSKQGELGKLIQTPVLTTYYNGLNMDDRNGQILFKTGNKVGYETYFYHTVEQQTNDFLYVFELSPKYNAKKLSLKQEKELIQSEKIN